MSLIFHNVFLVNSFIGVSDCCAETHGRRSIFHWPSRQQTRPFVQRRQNIYEVTHCNLCCVYLLSDWLPTSLPRQMDCFQSALDLLHVSIWESESQRKWEITNVAKVARCLGAPCICYLQTSNQSDLRHCVEPSWRCEVHISCISPGCLGLGWSKATVLKRFLLWCRPLCRCCVHVGVSLFFCSSGGLQSDLEQLPIYCMYLFGVSKLSRFWNPKGKCD